MILYSDATTPFGRKCLIAALEREIPLEERFIKLSEPGDFLDVNPLNQIPALFVERGKCYFDSDVILEYLDTLHGNSPLIPELNKFECKTAIHLANGVIESTLLRTMELRRPECQQSKTYVAHLEARVMRGINTMEKKRETKIGDWLNGEEITTAVALSYVDFRFSTEWRKTAPTLETWFGRVSCRKSMELTAPTRERPIAMIDKIRV
ncbi:MAG: glutathione S-transferase family protein [Pseudomonadota bacterium]|nr:glutathione S-transferase family protein [Pseudomonadota bacterium]